MKKILILLLAVTSFIISCKSNEPEEPYFTDNFNQAEFEEKFAKWKEQNIKNYEFTYKVPDKTLYTRALPPMNHTIKTVVKEGVSTVTYISSDIYKKLDFDTKVDENADYYMSCIEDLFEYIEEYHNIYKNEQETLKSIDFSILEYNELYGFPINFAMAAFHRGIKEGAAMDRYPDPEFHVSNFKILEE